MWAPRAELKFDQLPDLSVGAFDAIVLIGELSGRGMQAHERRVY
jgi:hypothetical protein